MMHIHHLALTGILVNRLSMISTCTQTNIHVSTIIIKVIKSCVQDLVLISWMVEIELFSSMRPTNMKNLNVMSLGTTQGQDRSSVIQGRCIV